MDSRYIQSFCLLLYGYASSKRLDLSSLCRFPHKIHPLRPPEKLKTLSMNKACVFIIPWFEQIRAVKNYLFVQIIQIKALCIKDCIRKFSQSSMRYKSIVASLN
jgi:hypothetical protein